MPREDIFTMNRRDLKRLHITRQILEKRITQREAGEMLELSERQIRRLVKRVEQEGDRGILHKSRGRAKRRLPLEF